MPRLLDALVGGWELTGQYQIQSGIPVVFGTNSFFSGVDPALPGGGTLNKWFDTSQFFPFPSKNTDISAYPAWTGIQNLPGYSYQPTATDKQNGPQRCLPGFQQFCSDLSHSFQQCPLKPGERGKYWSPQELQAHGAYDPPTADGRFQRLQSSAVQRAGHQPWIRDIWSCGGISGESTASN